MKKLTIISLALSVALNVLLGALLLDRILTGCGETPDGRLGVLARDISVGRFNSTETIFTLPKGLLVRDASASGMDWFEPYRFRLVVTSDDDSLVDYSANASLQTGQDAEYYSADVLFRKSQEEQASE